jgi:hypothetical protein
MKRERGRIGSCTFSICTILDNCNQLKSFQEGECEKRENNGGDELKPCIIYVYIEISQQNPHITIIY